jgi:hypothetical protein
MKVAHHFSGGLTFFDVSVPAGTIKINWVLRLSMRSNGRDQLFDRP